jgi:hypothetical protein
MMRKERESKSFKTFDFSLKTFLNFKILTQFLKNKGLDAYFDFIVDFFKLMAIKRVVHGSSIRGVFNIILNRGFGVATLFCFLQ